MRKAIISFVLLAGATCVFAQFGPGHDWAKGGGWTNSRSMPKLGGSSSNSGACYCGPDEYEYDWNPSSGNRFRITYHVENTGEYHYTRWVYNRNGTLQLCERRISMVLPGRRR